MPGAWLVKGQKSGLSRGARRKRKNPRPIRMSLKDVDGAAGSKGPFNSGLDRINEKGLALAGKSFSRSKGLVDSRFRSFPAAIGTAGPQPNLASPCRRAGVPG